MKKLGSSIIILMFIINVSISQETKFTPYDAEVEDSFGWSTSADGDFMAITNIYDDDLGIQSGSVYIYNFNGSEWVFQQKITASDGGFAEYFGYDINLSGNKLIVGAYRGNDEFGIETGSAYIYEYNGSIWEETAILQPPGGENDDRIGNCVSIYGNYAVVGAVYDDDLGDNCGAAYLYKFDGSNWVLDEKLTPVELDVNSAFGMSSAISDEYLAIGAGLDVEGGIESGTVYIYKYDGSAWSMDQIISPSDPMADQYFGKSVDIYNNEIVVGAYRDDIFGSNSGSSYVFERNTSWEQTQKLTPPMGQSDNLFGADVSIDGDDILCGTVNYSDGSYHAGAAFYYHRNNNQWVYQSTIKQPEAVPDARFGVSVSVSDGIGLLGAPYDDENGYRSGAAYIYTLEELLNTPEINASNNSFRIFPTITNNFITIEKTSDINKDVFVNIYDISGNAVYKNIIPASSKNLKLSLESFATGLYNISIVDGKNIIKKAKVIRN